MRPPTIYLIRRGLTEEKMSKLKDALSLTPLEAVIITAPQDAEYASEFHPAVTLLNRPIAIIGDFSEDCEALGEKTETLL